MPFPPPPSEALIITGYPTSSAAFKKKEKKMEERVASVEKNWPFILFRMQSFNWSMHSKIQDPQDITM